MIGHALLPKEGSKAEERQKGVKKSKSEEIIKTS